MPATLEDRKTVFVRFLRDSDGDVFAVFHTDASGTATVPADLSGAATVYARVGQHGAASAEYIGECEPATAEEYAELESELRGIYEADGDALVVIRADDSSEPQVVIDGSSGSTTEADYIEAIRSFVADEIHGTRALAFRDFDGDADDAITLANEIAEDTGLDCVFDWHPEYPGTVMFAPVEWFA